MLIAVTTTVGLGTIMRPQDKPIVATNEDVTCLAKNIYHEARGEPFFGQLAVAQVTVNRLISGKFGKTICDVVYAKNQFSWTNKKQKQKAQDTVAWNSAVKIAKAIIYNTNAIPELKATHYHATHVKPRWARYKEQVAVIGKHIFYL